MRTYIIYIRHNDYPTFYNECKKRDIVISNTFISEDGLTNRVGITCSDKKYGRILQFIDRLVLRSEVS